MTLAGGLTISGTPTFNANGGTFTFDGSTATLSCNNVTFSTVTISGNSAGVKTVNSNCNLPLGNNPTISNPVTLNGTLSGTGTLTMFANCCGTQLLTLNSGATFSGFSGFSGSSLTVAGATMDFSSYSTFTAASTVTLSSGSLALPNGADLNGTSTTAALSITGGTFNAPSGTMTLAGGLNITGTPTFNANGGTFTFDSSTAGTLSCNNVTFNLVTFNASGSASKTVNSNCSLPLGANPTITFSSGSLTVNGTLTGSGTIYEPSGGLILNSGAVLSGFTGATLSIFTVSGATVDLGSYTTFSTSSTLTLSSGSLTLPSGADLNGVLNITGGTFNAPSGTMTAASSFAHSSGTFNANNGTVVLDGNSQTISGSTTFNNLTKTSSSNVTLTFPASTTTTITGTLNLQGTSGSKLSLRSSSTGSQWRIDPQGGRSISNLDVKDSWNTNTNTILAGGTSSVDSGNNINWDFSTFVLSFSLDYPPGGSHITNSVPTFRWKKATTGSGTSVTKYEFWIDDPASTHDLYIDNIQPSYTTNQTFQFLNYTIKDDGDYLNLTPTSYSLNQGKNNWRVMAHDSAGNTREESVDFFLDPTTSTISYTNPTSTGTIIPISTPIPSPTPTPEPTPFENIFNNPVIPTITGNVQNFFDQIGPELQKLFSSFVIFVSANQQIIQKAAPVVLVGLLPLTGVVLLISNLTNTSLSWNMLVRSLQALGILPKGKTMGRVHEALSGVGVSFAVLTLKGVGEGTYNTDTFVSDSSGIYHGAKFPVGQYKLLANHQDYSFPTNQQKPMYLSSKDFYKGEVFSITDSRSDHFLSIPMDKRNSLRGSLSLKQKLGSLFRGVLSVIEKISKLLFWPFAVLSITLFVINMSVVNGVMASIYLIVILFKLTKKLISLFPTLNGVVVDQNSKPIEGVLVKLLTKDGQTTEVTRTNERGRYKLFSAKNKYQISVMKNGYVNTENPLGYLEVDSRKIKNFKVVMKSSF
jgi:hypothetical protein